jgi:hypothetical protein
MHRVGNGQFKNNNLTERKIPARSKEICICRGKFEKVCATGLTKHVPCCSNVVLKQV